jgi:hypothetical protein
MVTTVRVAGVLTLTVMWVAASTPGSTSSVLSSLRPSAFSYASF